MHLSQRWIPLFTFSGLGSWRLAAGQLVLSSLPSEVTIPTTLFRPSLTLSQQVGTLTVGTVVMVTATGTITVSDTVPAGDISLFQDLSSWDPGATAPSASAASSNSGSGSGLSTGSKAGIGVGAALGALLALGIGLWYGRRSMAKGKKKDEEPEAGGGQADLDGKTELDAVQAMVVEKDAVLEVGGGRPELETVERKEMEGSDASPSTTGGGDLEKVQSDVLLTPTSAEHETVEVLGRISAPERRFRALTWLAQSRGDKRAGSALWRIGFRDLSIHSVAAFWLKSGEFSPRILVTSRSQEVALTPCDATDYFACVLPRYALEAPKPRGTSSATAGRKHVARDSEGEHAVSSAYLAPSFEGRPPAIEAGADGSVTNLRITGASSALAIVEAISRLQMPKALISVSTPAIILSISSTCSKPETTTETKKPNDQGGPRSWKGSAGIWATGLPSQESRSEGDRAAIRRGVLHPFWYLEISGSSLTPSPKVAAFPRYRDVAGHPTVSKKGRSHTRSVPGSGSYITYASGVPDPAAPQSWHTNFPERRSKHSCVAVAYSFTANEVDSSPGAFILDPGPAHSGWKAPRAYPDLIFPGIPRSKAYEGYPMQRFESGGGNTEGTSSLKPPYRPVRGGETSDTMPTSTVLVSILPRSLASLAAGPAPTSSTAHSARPSVWVRPLVPYSAQDLSPARDQSDQGTDSVQVSEGVSQGGAWS
ncbi:unnamed protein product [Diplocarpon coronariae]